MKTLIPLLIVFLFVSSVQAQNESFNVQEEIKLLQQDIADLETEIKEVEKDDPEEAAELRKELAILKKGLSMLQNSAKVIAEATGNPNTTLEDMYEYKVPERNEVKIKNASSNIMNNNELTDHLKNTFADVSKTVSPKNKTLGLSVHEEINKSNPDSLDEGSLAVSYWLIGNPQFALYLQAQACNDNPLRPDWLNNYASMLTMTGAEERALPILQRLNTDFPQNETILHNIGMAWYGMGELSMAETYLDSAMIFPGNHSLAKFTKGLIEEKKGNKQEAIKNIEGSLEESFSEDKVKHLEKLGAKNIEIHIKDTEELKDEYLGLEHFVNMIPNYPKNGYQMVLAKKEWKAFHDALDNMIRTLEQEIEEYQDVVKKSMDKFTKGEIALTTQLSPVARKYIAKNLNTIILPTMEDFQRKLPVFAEEKMAIVSEIERAHEAMVQNMPLDQEAQCRVIDDFISYSNGKWEAYNPSEIKFMIHTINTMAQYQKYYITPTPEVYTNTLMQLKLQFLIFLSGIQYREVSNSCATTNPASSGFGKLPLFEDVHCEYVDKFRIPGVGTITTNCHYIELDYNPWLGSLPIDLRFKMKEDLLTGQHVGGSLTVGYSKSILPKGGLGELASKAKKYGSGPEKIDIKAGGSTTVEWDSKGISDVKVDIGVKGQIGSNLKNSDGSKVEGVKSLTAVAIKEGFSMKSGPSTQIKSDIFK